MDDDDVRKCAIHDEIEEFLDGSTQCAECGHVYVDEQAIIDEYNETIKSLPVPEITSVDGLTFCPLCLHDW